MVKDEKGDSKRQRTSYTRFQTLELEKEFHFNRLLAINQDKRKSTTNVQVFDAATENRDRARIVHV